MWWKAEAFGLQWLRLGWPSWFQKVCFKWMSDDGWRFALLVIKDAGLDSLEQCRGWGLRGSEHLLWWYLHGQVSGVRLRAEREHPVAHWQLCSTADSDEVRSWTSPSPVGEDTLATATSWEEDDFGSSSGNSGECCWPWNQEIAVSHDEEVDLHGGSLQWFREGWYTVMQMTAAGGRGHTLQMALLSRMIPNALGSWVAMEGTCILWRS